LWAMYGLWMLHYYSGESRAAFSLAERLSAVASSSGEPFAIVHADRLIGNALHHEGDQPRAQKYLEDVIERSVAPTTRRSGFDPQVDHRVYARATLSRVLLLRGYLDQATEQARASFEEAVATGYDLIICQSLRLGVCSVALMTGDLAAAVLGIARLVDIGRDVPVYKSAARCLEGKLLVEQGAFEAGSVLLRSELDACAKIGWTNWYPEYLGDFAKGLAGLGRISEALTTIDLALAKADQGGERYYVAELLRLKGEFLLAGPDRNHPEAIEDCFRAGLEVARRQGALLFELRLALSVARLRAGQDRRGEARAQLAPVYDRFTEGFETLDLRAAKAFLDELSD